VTTPRRSQAGPAPIAQERDGPTVGELQYDSPADPAAARHHWLVELLACKPGDWVVDLGCGDGMTLGLLPEQVVPIVIDLQAGELRRAAGTYPGRLGLVCADLTMPLPLVSSSVDRALCHNVLETLPDPGRLLEEAHRVLRPGGRLVLSHPDYDTMVFPSPDREHLELTRRLVHAYYDTQQDWMTVVDGTIGRRLPAIAHRSPLTMEEVHAATVVSRDWKPGMLGYEFAHHVVAVLGRAGRSPTGEPIAGEVLEGWLAGMERLVQGDDFLWSINDYAVVLQKPAVTTGSTR
jgi:SAM-dependent methyltransferase